MTQCRTTRCVGLDCLRAALVLAMRLQLLCLFDKVAGERRSSVVWDCQVSGTRPYIPSSTFRAHRLRGLTAVRRRVFFF